MELKTANMLFLEDEETLAQTIIPLFQIFVKKVYYAATIQQALNLFEKEKIDLIFTDVNLVAESGLDFIKTIRSTHETLPIVILSALKDEVTLIRSIPLGLSGYLLKPINYTELVNVFEECKKKLRQNHQTVISIYDGYYYDFSNKHVIKDGVIYKLAKKEILFFELIANNLNKIITKEMIASYVYLHEDMSDSALHNLISRIKKRFGKYFLLTVPDIGYRVNI